MAPQGPPTYLDWRADPATARLPPPDLPSGRRNFGCPHRATATQALHCAGGTLLQSVQDLLPLAECIVKQGKAESAIPAGYTYLGQLLAHDLCSAAEGVFDYALLGGSGPAIRQPLQRPGQPLHLESLLGPISAGARPLELWRFADAPHQFPAFSADLPRGASPDRAGLGRKQRFRIGRNQAQVHDPRNDDTPMMAQLSALFIELARRASGALPGQQHIPAKALRIGRVTAARVWHRILQQDYLPRLCLPGLPLGLNEHVSHLIPVELTHAVLRMGHWMVRGQYLLGEDVVSMATLLRGQPDMERLRRRPGSADFWRIDWRNFFTLDPDHPPQHALRLSGGIAPMFGSDFSLPEGLEIHSALVRSSNDLALRDLVRSMDGGLQTVAALVNYLEPALCADHPDWALWQPERRRALIDTHCASWAKTQALQVPLAAHLIADPPLYLYLLAEAGAEGQAEGFGGGHSLGALGSALLAASVNATIAASAASLPDLPEAPDCATIASMPSLIAYLSRPSPSPEGATP